MTRWDVTIYLTVEADDEQLRDLAPALVDGGLPEAGMTAEFLLGDALNSSPLYDRLAEALHEHGVRLVGMWIPTSETSRQPEE